MKRSALYAFVLGLTLIAWFSTFNPSVKSVNKQITANISPIVMGQAPDGNVGSGVVGGKCNIEFINGAPFGAEVYTVTHDAPLTLTGWGMDNNYSRLPQSVMIRLTSAENLYYFLFAQAGLPRSDVREYYSLSKDLLTSGFELNAVLRNIPVGEYTVSLVMIFEDTALICSNGRKIRRQ